MSLLAGWNTWQEVFRNGRLFAQGSMTLGQQLGGSLIFGDGIVKVMVHSGIVRVTIIVRLASIAILASIVRLAGNRHVTSCTLGRIVGYCEQGVEGDGFGRGLGTGFSCGGCGWSKLNGCASGCIRLLVLVEVLSLG
jgi:hypothetical protein